METQKHSLLAFWTIGGILLLVFSMPGFAFAQTYGEGTYSSGEYSEGELQTPSGGGIYRPPENTQATSTSEAAERAALLQQILDLTKELLRLQTQLGLVPSTAAGLAFTTDLSTGAEGEDVRRLQQFLNAQGHPLNAAAGEAGSPGYETTYFGDLTREALARFQAAHNITPAVGYFGPITREVVNSLIR